jgi:CelD/BcsL family acetyltransferase involved in cellulose biosynthesis
MTTLRVRRWSNEEFLAGRESWQQLLARSDADPLFMSWDWLACWWQHHAASLGAELCVLAIYSSSDELCGLAPFYLHDATHRDWVRVRRLELLGNAWRDSDAVFSEYLDLIADRNSRESVCDAVRQWLKSGSGWDELVLCNVRVDSLAARLARACTGFVYARRDESMMGWRIDLPQSFEAFAAALSSNTRRKVLHQREKLADISCRVIEQENRPAALAQLVQFVARRWSRPASEDVRTRFHADLPERFTDQGVLRLSEMRAGPNCVSVMLNLRVAGTEYYLQSGFDGAYARGISPGYLHLGFAIEAACRDGLRRFDFLAGRGLHRDYKRDFAAASTPLESLHIVRKPSLRVLFRLADRLRGWDQIV